MGALLNEAKKIKKFLLMDKMAFNLFISTSEKSTDDYIRDYCNVDEDIYVLMELFAREG